jgi:hypothetical protein
MRLTKLLLGSAAIVFASGAAYAADNTPAAPVVAPQPVNAVEKCTAGSNQRSGWLKPGSGINWCYYFSGTSSFSTRFGMEIDSQDSETYPTQPDNNFWGDTPSQTTMSPIGDWGWNGYSLSNSLSLTVYAMTPAGPITVVIPIVGGGSTSLAVGDWRFTGNSMSVSSSLGNVDLSLMLSEPTGDWNGGSSGNGVGPWPQIDAGVGFGMDPWSFSLDWFVGPRNWIVPPPASPPWEIAYGVEAALGFDNGMTSAEVSGYWERTFDDGYDPVGAPPAIPGLGIYNIWGAALDLGFEVGMAEVNFTAEMDHMILNPLGLAVPAGRRVLGNAFGFSGDVGFGLGMADVTVGGAVGINNGRYTNYHFRDQPLGTYWQAFVETGFDINDDYSAAFEVEYNQGPVASDGALIAEASLTYSPFTALSVTGGVQHTWTQIGVNATSANFGVTVRY